MSRQSEEPCTPSDGPAEVHQEGRGSLTLAVAGADSAMSRQSEEPCTPSDGPAEVQQEGRGSLTQAVAGADSAMSRQSEEPCRPSDGPAEVQQEGQGSLISSVAVADSEMSRQSEEPCRPSDGPAEVQQEPWGSLTSAVAGAESAMSRQSEEPCRPSHEPAEAAIQQDGWGCLTEAVANAASAMERQTELCTPSDGPGLAVEVQQEVLRQVVRAEAAGPSRQHAPVVNVNMNFQGDRSTIVVGGASTFNVGRQSPRQEGGRAVYNDCPASSSYQGASPEQGCVSSETILQEISQKLRQHLKDHYTREGSYVQLDETVDDDQRHMTEIYTELLIEKREGVADVSTNTGPQNLREEKLRKGGGDMIAIKSTDYDKMFETKTREGKLVDRIVFCGTGGIGKSTIFAKIAYDWATESSEVLAKFQFVFSLKMFALEESSDLTDAILDQLLYKDLGVTKDSIDSLIRSNQDKVLILLDGFDELRTAKLSPSAFGSILQALNRNMHRNCCICISTRPSRLDELMSKSLVQNPCTHIQVRGFLENGVHEYINRFHKDRPDIADSLIRTVGGSGTLRDLSKSPMLLLLMCMLCRESEKLPETTSRLFAEAVYYMFARKDLTEKQRYVFFAIGKVALRGLLAPNKQFSFSEDEFKQDVLNEALKTGILTRQRVFKSHRSQHSVQFMHTTMQEYCAAKYWQDLHNQGKGFANNVLSKLHVRKNEFQEILQQVCRANPKTFELLLCFCCGDNEICTRGILGCLIKYHRRDIQRLLRRCYFEAQLSETPIRSYIQSMVPEGIDVDGDDDIRALGHILANICLSNKSAEDLAHICGVFLCNVSRVTDVVPYLNQCVNVEKLLLMLQDRNRSLQLGNNTSWIPSLLTPMKQLKMLELRLFQVTDFQHIASSVGRMEKLTDLDLCEYYALGGTAKSWAPYLPLMKQLKKLRLRFCSLQCGDFKHIASSVGKIEKLTDLDLSGNNSLGGTAASWAPHLDLMKQLEKLSLRWCSLQYGDVKHIVGPVLRMKKLTMLDVSSNKLSKDLWNHHLPFEKRLVLPFYV